MEQRNEALDPQQHERLCAWMFGEMADDECTAFEAEMATDAVLQAERDRLERTVGLVRGLADDGGPTLEPARREELVGSLAARAPRRGLVRFAAAAAVVVAATGGGLWWALREGGVDEPRREQIAQGDELMTADGSFGLQPEKETRSRESEVASAEEKAKASDVHASAPVEQAGAELDDSIAEAVDTRFRSVAPDAGGGNLNLLSADRGDASGAPAGFDVFSVGGQNGQMIQLPQVTTGVPLTVGGHGGGGYRGPGDVAGSKARDAQPSAGISGGLFFHDESQGDVRARIEHFYGRPLGDELEPMVQSVTRVETLPAGPVASYLPQQVFDPDRFFHDCELRKGERPRDMFFRFWGDHAFVLTRGDALATFAADVDTASYVLARRYLRDGVLPEKAQVRTEEFVNYFDPDLAPPTEGDFAIHTELAPSPFGGSNARYLLRVGLRARVIPAELREPLALTFVVDTSGSMKEDQRLELVKHALMTLVSKLDERDRIGLVTFSNEARLVLPMTDASKVAEIAAVVQGLQPDGSTNAEAGLKLGYELAATALDPERLSRVVFLSDGVANVGQTDQDRINADVVERRQAGILLNTIGVGMDNHNDVFLEQLANKGDGVCDYVDDSRAVHRAIVERFTGAFQPVAADVKIQVEFDDGKVLRWRQIGYENRVVADQDFRNDAVDAGEIGSGHQVTALFELETALTPDAVQAQGDASWATVRVRWLPPRRAGDDPAKREATEVERRVDASAFTAAFESASPGFRRAALVAQFAEVLRRSTHAMGDSYATLKQGIQQLALLPEFTTDDDTVELVSLVQRAEELGITTELERTDLAKACDEYKRHQYLRQQVAQLEEGLRQGELEELRNHNDRLEERIRELVRRH